MNFGRTAWVSLALVISFAAIVLLFLAPRYFLGYDSYWHVFIARQEDWITFWQEVRENAHPPAFYLALRTTTDLFGLSLLSYRLPSIVGTLLATLLIAQIVWKLTRNAWLAVVASAAFGLSFSAAVMALEVRAYAAGVSLILLSLSLYLDWMSSWPNQAPRRTYVGFAMTSSAAIATSYQSLFYLAAAMAAPLLVLLVDWPTVDQVRARLKRYACDAPFLFGLPILTAVVLYLAHIRLWDRALTHVPRFMFDPAQDPSVIDFVSRKSSELAGLFVPGMPDASAGFVASVGLVAVAGLTLASDTRKRLVVSVPITMLLLMLGMNMLAGVQRRYPFGGELRHEFFLFPFIVISAFTIADPRRFFSRVSPSGDGVWVLGLAGLVALNVSSWLPSFSVSSRALMQDQIDRFRSVFGVPTVVATDQFNFMNVFAHHHDWQWYIQQERGTENLRQVWRVSKGEAQFFVCRLRDWHLDLSQPSFYEQVSACATATRSGRVAVFRPQQEGFRPNWNTMDTADIARRLGPAAGLRLEQIVADDADIYATFIRDPP